MISHEMSSWLQDFPGPIRASGAPEAASQWPIDFHISGKSKSFSSCLFFELRGQRRRLFMFLGSALAVYGWLYLFGVTRSLTQLQAGMFLAAIVFNGLFSFWGNYLPTVFPTYPARHRIELCVQYREKGPGAPAAPVSTQLANLMPVRDVGHRLAYSAGTVATPACIISGRDVGVQGNGPTAGVSGFSAQGPGVMGTGVKDAGVMGLHGYPKLQETTVANDGALAGVFGASDIGAGWSAIHGRPILSA